MRAVPVARAGAQGKAHMPIAKTANDAVAWAALTLMAIAYTRDLAR